MCHISFQGVVDLGVLQAVAPHLGVLVVDGVDEDEDDRDNHHRDGYKASYEGKVVLCDERDKSRPSTTLAHVQVRQDKAQDQSI